MLELKDIIKLSFDDKHNTDITVENVMSAKAILFKTPQNNKELVELVVAMNLINAALKRKEFKSKERDALIYYGMLKPKISKLFHYILEDNFSELNRNFYIDKSNQCAYIEIDGLQFSFHNISITEKLQNFIDSDGNKPKAWRGVRLQKIAGELFDYYINEKEA